jgi:hypothetical protein
MSDEKSSTGFIVKAVSSTGQEMWASRQQFGHRIFGPREKAEVFRTRPEARAAIGQMPGAFDHAGFTFRVESAE